MQKYGLVRTVALPQTAPFSAQIVGPSDRRVAILFSPPKDPKTIYTLSNDPNVTLGAGINILHSAGNFLVTGELFGDAVRKPWYAIASATMTIGFLETTQE
jgi:hypothetical protein